MTMTMPLFYRKTTRVERRMMFDISVRVALGIFFAFTAGIYFRNAMHDLSALDLTRFSPLLFSKGMSIAACGLYMMMVAFMYALRRKPVNKFVGYWPSFASLVGGFLMFAVLWLEPAHLTFQSQIIASLMILVGNGLAAVVLIRLGRSFSIIPEGRKLVTTGVYKYIRHPLYLTEAIATLGLMILFISPEAVLLVMVQFWFQFVRMHYEEKVLKSTFASYKNYMKRTARLMPGVY